MGDAHIIELEHIRGFEWAKNAHCGLSRFFGESEDAWFVRRSRIHRQNAGRLSSPSSISKYCNKPAWAQHDLTANDRYNHCCFPLVYGNSRHRMRISNQYYQGAWTGLVEDMHLKIPYAICRPKSSSPTRITPALEQNVSALKRSSNFMLRSYLEWSTIISPRFPRFLGRRYARANFRETLR